MSIEEKFNAAVNVIRNLPKNGKINFEFLSLPLSVALVYISGKQTDYRKEEFSQLFSIFHIKQFI